MASINFGRWTSVSFMGSRPTWINTTGIFARAEYVIKKIDGTHYAYADGKLVCSRMRLQDAKNELTELAYNRDKALRAIQESAR